MADFTSEFWSWFIIIPTVAGFIFCLALVFWMSGGAPSDGEAKPTGHVWDEDLEELSNPLPGWWLNLFYITIAFGAIYLVLYPGLGSYKGVLNWTSLDRYEKEVKAADKRFSPIYKAYAQEKIRTLVHDSNAMKTGQRLFTNYCTVCHGSDAGGAPGFPNLYDSSWLYGGQPEQIKQSIMSGRAGVMPAWEQALGAKGVHEVAEYVLSLSGRKVNITVAEAGQKRFKAMCVACHGKDGRGNTALGAPNLTDNIWLYGGSQKTVIESIAKGRAGKMPAHKDFLGADKVHLLAAYIFSLSR
jgi:cytochrome c oxidase cbb3-type subunit 3